MNRDFALPEPDPARPGADKIRRLFLLAATLYVLIYAFEAPIRYGLHLVGMDDAIFVRDLMLALPLLLLFIRQCIRGTVHPAFWVFALVVAVHGSVGYLNFHALAAPVYGAKFLLPVLFGFILSSALVQPSRKLLLIFALLWLVSLVALYLDKYVLTYPWSGMETKIGGLTVDVSRGWDITSGEDKRVAGFTRSSIDAASLLPVLAFLVIQRSKLLMRTIVLAATGCAIFLTTQKGALLACVAVAAIFALPRRMWYAMLCFACVSLTLLAIVLPIATSGLLMPTGGGVFSLASFGMRITDTWPDAWRWIANHDIFPFATGLGGLSGAMRFFAQDFYNPSDNFFIFLYGNFGVPALFYLAWANYEALSVPAEMRPFATAALAILAFDLGYGAVIAILEGPFTALFLGASLGTLWRLRQQALHRKWADPFNPAWRHPIAVPAPAQPQLPA